MNANDNVNVNFKHKDTLFRFLFGRNRKYALSLYNALNGSSYTNEDDLEFTTLEDVIYMKYKNDTSFLFDASLNLYEHQSSYNPNMPLRGFLYFADLYRKLLPETERLYGRTLVKIPTPRYIVFYNGPEADMKEDYKVLRLSDAFEDKSVCRDYEWTATMININVGANKDLMEKCSILQEYSIFIGKIKAYRKEMELKEAVDRAVEECIRDNILRDLLCKHQREVYNMCLTEFDEKKYEQIIREEGRAEGREEGRVEGRAEGRAEGRLNAIRNMIELGLSKEQILTKYSREEYEKAVQSLIIKV